MGFQDSVRSIKKLKIQGATHIAIAAAEALVSFAQKNSIQDRHEFLRQLHHAKRILESTRVTEPAMRNVLSHIIAINPKQNIMAIKHELQERKKNILARLFQAQKELIAQGLKVIKKNSIVYTHCHSSTVTALLIAAKKKGITVNNTETRPLFQGRKTALELARAGIKVKHFVDSAIELALKDADMMMVGADAVDNDGIYNKIGTSTFAKLARQKGIPVYVCSTAFKVDKKKEFIEQRSPVEVWPIKQKNLALLNPAFDKTALKEITAIISEFGVLKPKVFFRKAVNKF